MSELRTLWIPTFIAALAVLVLLVDVLIPRAQDGRARLQKATGWLVVVGMLGAFAATFFVDASGRAAFGAYEGGAWATFVQRIVLAAGALGALGAVDDVAARTPRRQGEYWLLMLSSLLGMVLVPGARDLVLVVVAFELMGIPLYVLAAYAKTDAEARPGQDPRKSLAAEAALKLYLVGAASTAVTLFGLALLTGATGTSRLEALAAAPSTPLGTLGMLFVLGGIGYKIGMVPFHMWIPDTYQGASVPFVAFLSVAPKAAGVSVLATIFLSGLGTQRAVWLAPVSIAALMSMGVGNLLALLCFLLSLAGIPFVVGFWAKLYVFLAAWRAGLAWLVASGIVLAVMSLFYYLRVLRAAYMVDDGADRPAPAPAPALRLAIGLCLVAVVGLGLWPRPLVDSAARAGADLLDRTAAVAGR